MAARKRQLKYQKHPGLADAARYLGTTYSHLRRVVLGERKGPLLDFYRAWQQQQATLKTKPTSPTAS